MGFQTSGGWGGDAFFSPTMKCIIRAQGLDDRPAVQDWLWPLYLEVWEPLRTGGDPAHRICHQADPRGRHSPRTQPLLGFGAPSSL